MSPANEDTGDARERDAAKDAAKRRATGGKGKSGAARSGSGKAGKKKKAGKPSSSGESRGKKAADKASGRKATGKQAAGKASARSSGKKVAKAKAASTTAGGTAKAATSKPSAGKPSASGKAASGKAGGKAKRAPSAKAAGPPSPPVDPAVPTPADFDPYHAPATIGELDLHLFAEGRHAESHRHLGSHVRVVDGVPGVSFAVWAPNASRVEIVGDFTDWAEAGLPLRALGDSGVHEAFIPGVRPGQRYKLRLRTFDGQSLLKTDPFARAMEGSPHHASVVCAPAAHRWTDASWMAARPQADPVRRPLHIYEVHLGSWVRVLEDGGRSPTYREIAPHLAKHVKQLGFTHVELMPVMEHPFGGSWGYQVTGYFAVTSRYGTPDDLREFIDVMHAEGLGVILDWVPAHFPADDHALARFDGTALFEHEDPRRGKHPDWNTLIFNYGRHEVASFLLSNAVFWLEEFHADGLRVDAVASMLFLDYSRADGEWVANEHGGRENLEAVALLKLLTTTVRERLPGALMIAEESTTWPKVTEPVEQGGLGFHFKWNLGWMHDSLDYFSTDPLFRGGCHDKLTFSIWYEWSEHFLMSLSHDEVVHGKGSLAGRMWGQTLEQRLANLRMLLAWMVLRPGKQLLFMGAELGSHREWDHDGSLDWHLADQPEHAGLTRWLGDLGRLYQQQPCFWRGDPDTSGFRWIDCEDRDRSVLSFLRVWEHEAHIVVLNLTPIAREGVELGVPGGSVAVDTVLCSDGSDYGGAGEVGPGRVVVRAEPRHGLPASIRLDVPGLTALVLTVERDGDTPLDIPAQADKA